MILPAPRHTRNDPCLPVTTSYGSLQIVLAVLVVVEREFAVVARHELRVAHRAGVRALGLARIDAAIAAQREEFDQFAEEERAARRMFEALQIGRAHV